MKNEFDRSRTRVIDRAKKISLPLKEIVRPLGIPMIFSVDRYQLSFHELGMGVNDAMWLTKNSAKTNYNFTKGLIVKRKRQPMIALLTGTKDSIRSIPVAAIFNLTDPELRQVLIPTRGQFHPLENDHTNSGGLGISRLSGSNPRNEVVQISLNKEALLVDVPNQVEGL